jgi:hypothetical protein
MIEPIASTKITDAGYKRLSVQYSNSTGNIPSKIPLAPATSASPLDEGERTEVRGLATRSQQHHPHPTLSLEKGEANMR